MRGRFLQGTLYIVWLIGCFIVLSILGSPKVGEEVPGVTLGPRTTTWSADQIRNQIVESNLNSPMFGRSGRLTRWKLPILVNTNHILRAEEAVDRFQRLTNGLITFQKTESIPANGIIFLEGGGINADGSPGCGNVTNSPEPSRYVKFERDPSGTIRGQYYVHLGSTACDDELVGDYSSAAAEHELAHILGLEAHFDGFTGNEGLRHPNLFTVIYNIYSNPIGARANQLKIQVVSVPRDFYRVPPLEKRGAELVPWEFEANKSIQVTLMIYKWKLVKSNLTRIAIRLMTGFKGNPLNLLPDIRAVKFIHPAGMTYVIGIVPVSWVEDHWEGKFTLIADPAVDRIEVGGEPTPSQAISLPFVIRESKP